MNRRLSLIALVLCLIALPGSATGSQASGAAIGAAPSLDLVVDGEVIGKRLESQPGETCLVCNKPVHEGDPTYLADGQRVPLHVDKCEAAFRAAPKSWLARLKPRGAFIDAGPGRGELSNFWLIIGLYVLAGLIFGALSAHRAFTVGRSAKAWLGLGLVGNLPAFLFLLMLPKRDVRALAGIPSGLGKIAATYAPENCPRCGTENHPSATACEGCGAQLTPKRPSEVMAVGLRPS